jgi:CDP-paratose 2-epimerase
VSRGDGTAHEDGAGNGGGTAAPGPVLITGGAGFIGSNLAARLLADGEDVLILDDLSRPGVEDNLRWLAGRFGDRVQHADTDIRDAAGVTAAVDGASFVFHFAAQVAVTTSLARPREDHAINVIGTLNLLEAIRSSNHRPGLLFASTNKVYGALPDVGIRRAGARVAPEDESVGRYGVDESRRLDFISPYGCSKGAADQYVLDYCRSFDLHAVVFRMSCIYGPHQHATSDQGWVAHFLRTALNDERLTIYGDGRQVRDVLYIDDFVEALLAARRDLSRITGHAFNIGGGTANTLSLKEMMAIAERLVGRPLDVVYAGTRPGDQPWFAADHRRFSSFTAWHPVTSPEEGIDALWTWLLESSARPTESPVLQPRESRP